MVLEQSVADEEYQQKVTPTNRSVLGAYRRLNNYKEEKQTLINAIADTPNSEPSANSKYICLIL